MPTELDELINLAKTPIPEDKEKILFSIDESEAKKFVTDFGIIEGNKKIKFDMIYTLYENWSNDPVSRSVFGKQLNKLFKSKRDATGSYFFLDGEPFKDIAEYEKKATKKEKIRQE